MEPILTLGSWCPAGGCKEQVLPVGLEETWDYGSRYQGTRAPILMDVAKTMAAIVGTPVSCSSS